MLTSALSMQPTAATVRLLAFAGARDVVGSSELELEVPALRGSARCTQDELWAALLSRFPGLAPYRASIRLALNGAYASREDDVGPGDEVAIIPPVAGG